MGTTGRLVRIRTLSGFLAGLSASLLGTSPSPAASPQLESVSPPGLTRGEETTLTLQGRRLDDAVDLIFYENGVELRGLEAASPKELKATLVVAEDCRLGEHGLRIRTRSGISELRTFFVGDLPSVEEKEPNSDFAEPQEIPLGVTVAGGIGKEDVDYFAFEARKGQRVTAEIEGMRLGGVVFDPFVAILDERRFELAACDDIPLLGQDAVASVKIPEDGRYLVLVREASYGGDDRSRYRLHLGTFPRPLAVLPGGGRPGEELEVVFLGDVEGEIRRKVRIPAECPPDFGLFVEDEGGVTPSPVPFRVNALESSMEVEPNDSREKATALSAPGAGNGVISRPGDVDFWRVDLKKGQTIDVHVYGRRLRSPLDSLMRVHDASGKELSVSDDSAGPDSYVRFKAPADAEYRISVTDHLRRGGPTSVYRVELTPVRPRVTLGIPEVAQFSQERQTIVVPRGNRYAALVSARREGYGGDLSLDVQGLPAGLSWKAESFPRGTNGVPVLFEAAPDAALGGALARIHALPVEDGTAPESVFRQDVELVVGPPGQSVYHNRELNRLAVAVVEEVPFRIRLEEPRVPILRNGSMGLRVTAERAEGFEAPIRLEMVFQPPGISAGGGVTISEGKTEAVIPINAGGGAPVREWKVAVLASADAGQGPIHVSSALVPLRVEEPFFTLSPDRAAVEQGGETGLLCKVQHSSPLKGSARVELLGLPPRVTSEPVEVTPETEELVFRVVAAADSPTGRHKGLFCRVTISQEEGTLVHGAGGTELRIDPPPPPEKDTPPGEKTAKPAPEKKPAEQKREEKPRPLTRLEKLRLEARKRSSTGEEGSP